MKLYKTKITPLSSFITTLKGDTIFGHICWALKFSLGENRLNELLAEYEKSPFLVVSDAFISNYLPKPTAPSSFLSEKADEKKQNRKKIWINQNDLQNGDFSQAKADAQLNNSNTKNLSIKNTINRLTFCSDNPFGLIEQNLKDKDQDIYFLFDENKINIDELKGAFELVAKMGYGKKASIGKGRFKISDFIEITDFLSANSNSFIALSPSILDGFNEVYYEPFTRFGKHGATLANDKPFKAPILLANTGALIVPNDDEKSRILKFGYIGKGIKGHSSHANSVQQGYAIVISTKVAK